MTRAVIVERETGEIELEYVKVGKSHGITEKERERINKGKPHLSCLKYIYSSMEREKVKKIFDILG